MVSHVKVVSILMIVNGALMSLLGVMTAALGPLMFAAMSMSEQSATAPDKAVGGFLTILYMMLGGALLVAGGLNIFGGIRGLAFRSRLLILVALFSNLVSLLTCYCAPLSLGVMIYGLIVLFQPDVIDAFDSGSRHHPPNSMKL